VLGGGAKPPLVGRDDQLAAAAERLLGSPAGLVVEGPRGIGRTRVLDELAGRGLGVSVIHRTDVPRSVVGTVALGPFLDLLPTDGPGPEHDGRLETETETGDAALTVLVARVVSELVAKARASPPGIVVIDDADALDGASATVVAHLLGEPSVRLLLACATGPSVPTRPESGAWLRDERLAHLELLPLSADQVGELAMGLLGASLDQTSIERLASCCEGRPHLVQELLLDAEASGRLTGRQGLVHWAGPGGTPRLAGIVATELAGASPEVRELVDLLALAGAVPLEVASAMVGAETLALAEACGALALAPGEDGAGHGPDRWVRIDGPFVAEVCPALLGPLQVGSLARRLLDGYEAAGVAPAVQRLARLRWQREVGMALDAATATEGAQLARAEGDLALALELARAAHAQQPTAVRAWLLAELLETHGDPVTASHLLDGLVGRFDDDAERAQALAAQLQVLNIGLRRPDLAEAALDQLDHIEDRVWRGYVEAQWATFLAMAGRLPDATRYADRLLQDPDDRVRLRVLPAANLAAYAVGRFDDAHVVASSLIGPALSLREQVPSGVALVFSALAFDLLALGRLEELEGLLALATDPSAGGGPNRAYVLAIEGTLALRRGQVRTAQRVLAESAGRFVDGDPQGYRPAVLGLLAQACVLAGDPDAAEVAADEAEAVLEDRPPRLIDFETRRGLAWLPVASGDRRSAVRALRAEADRARGAGLHGFELFCLHDAIRLGAGERTIARTGALARRVQGPWASEVAAHADALRGDAAGPLEEVALAFAARGEHLVAAEAWAGAARRHRTAGVAAGARRASHRSRQQLDRCEGALLLDAPDEVVARLTARERHVASLAAAGRSSQAIADELEVSRRTVDNQLSRVYAKLGIGGRGELAEAIEGTPRP
jgi:DNA-binding CsgD family transcriptional regulator